MPIALNYFRISFVVCLLLSLMACTHWGAHGPKALDRNPEELTTKEFYKETIKLKTSITQVEKMYPLFKLNNVFAPQSRIYTATKKARVWWITKGLTAPATMALIEFEQPNTNTPHVTAKIYSADPSWDKHPQEFIDMLMYRVDNS